MSTPSLGQRIRRARIAAKLTQGQLGKDAGVTPQAVTKWESDVASPSRTNIVTIAKVTGVSVQWLLIGDLRVQGENATIPSWVDGGRSVPVQSIFDAVRRVRPDEDAKRVFAHFHCGENAFAIDLVDDSNTPIYPNGTRWIVDPDKVQQPGQMVMAVFGDVKKPIFGELREFSVAGGTALMVVPLNDKWASVRGDVQSLEIIAVMTEAITRPR
jgi:repressor LexA